MSSRALRKAQREREEQAHLEKLQQEAEALEESSEEEEEISPVRPQKSAFALLNEQGDADDEGGEAPQEAQESDLSDSEEEQDVRSSPAHTTTSSKRRKKKKKQAKGGAKADHRRPEQNDSVDDIDAALKDLSTSKPAAASTVEAVDPAAAELCKLLSVETTHLHAANEMRRLFGRAALENEHEEEANAGGRRRNRGQQQVGLAAALGRRQGAQGGRGNGLGLLGLRRNIFIQGKEEWPIGTAGGLGMEMVKKNEDGTVEYRFVHNTTYQDVQGQFETCVASMDPERLIALLQVNPYHISTLLQVSEIAKQERDHATSGDLLERSLFSFGRAVHSTFASSLAQGKARLDFRRPENREFWLAVSRYMANLGMRATWRTVYEWAKLLLALDPENDPYRMSLVMDLYALRARQYESYANLSSSSILGPRWKPLPNVQFSKGLALVNAGQASQGKQALYTAVSRYPWVVARLFQDLNIDAPPAVWGKSPRTDWEKLHSELYATRAKDIWGTPEASNLLVEISSAVSTDVPDPAITDKEISADEGRHVLLTDTPALIGLLPRSITGKMLSISDPLPPADNLVSYQPRSGALHASQRQGPALGNAAESLRELQGLYGWFAELFPWFNPTRGDGERPPEMTEEEVERRIEESGVSEETLVQRTQRMVQLQRQLMGGQDGGQPPQAEEEE